MQKLLVILTIVLFSFSALAETKTCIECQDLSDELKCRRAWKKWLPKAKKCVPWKKRKTRKGRNRVIVKKVIVKKIIVRETPPKAALAPVIIYITQKQKTSTAPKGDADIKRSLAVPIAGSPNNDELKRWNIGAGIYAFGLWTDDEKDMFFGPYGALSFGLGDRVRISGMLGYAFSPFFEPHNLLIGGHLGVRLVGRLFLLLTFDSLWANFDGATVRQRIFAGGLGAEYWPKKWVSVSLRVNVGYKSNVPSCGDERGFVNAGNSLAIGFHF